MTRFAVLPLSVLLLVLLFLCTESLAKSEESEEYDVAVPSCCGFSSPLLIKKDQWKPIFETKFGQISTVQIGNGCGGMGPYKIHSITLEPNTILLPLLLHSDMVFFVDSGSGILNWVDEEAKSTEIRLGDVYRLRPGSVFYLQSKPVDIFLGTKLKLYAIFSNNDECLHDPCFGAYSSITDLMFGFDETILQSAFGVPEGIIELMRNRTKPPLIVSETLCTPGVANTWQLQPRLLKLFAGSADLVDNKKKKEKKEKKEKVKKAKTFNVFESEPDFESPYGRTITINRKDLKVLKGSMVGVSMVNLTQGSMMGPHWNPWACEISIVLKGAGMVRVLRSSKVAKHCESSERVGNMEKNKRAIGFLLLVVLINGVMMTRSNGYEGEEEWGGAGGGEWGGAEGGGAWGGGGGGGGAWGGEGEGGGEWGGGGEGGGGGRRGWFMMRESRQVIKSEGGEMRVVLSPRGRIIEKPMHIGFLTMEPKTLFVPQYLDSSLLIFIRQGEATLGVICKDEFGERKLKAGDIYWIPAGSVFYLHNTGLGQRLHVICSIDPTQSLGFETFQPFYIGGGPSSVLAGFDPHTLTSAFNVSLPELQQMMMSQFRGPIVYVTEGPQPQPQSTVWTQFLGLRGEEKHKQLKKLLETKQGSPQDQQYSSGWSWRNIVRSILDLTEEKNKGSGSSECEDSYNIYDKKDKPSFDNKYGWSIALDYDDYKPLKHSGIGVYLVNLTAGAMMAPHMNPTATEYGIVLAGSGEIQVVFPNGTSAMNTRVSVGDVFWIPRYFAFCQIASRTGPFEFVGFTTSAHKNRPQFLVGSNSLLRTLNLTSLSIAFGVDEETMRRFIEAQREAVILPTPAAAPPHVGEMVSDRFV